MAELRCLKCYHYWKPPSILLVSFGIFYGIKRLDILKLVLLNMVQNWINIKYLRDSNTRNITRSSSIWTMTHIVYFLLWCYHFFHYVSRYTLISIFTIMHVTCICECPLCTAYFTFKQWTKYLKFITSYFITCFTRINHAIWC